MSGHSVINDLACRSPTAKTTTTGTQKALIVTHHKLCFNLTDRIHRHTNNDQQARTAKIE
jgi:hypothetical protein